MSFNNLYFMPILRNLGVSMQAAPLKDVIGNSRVRIPYCTTPSCIAEYYRRHSTKVLALEQRLKKVEIPYIFKYAFPKEEHTEAKKLYSKLPKSRRERIRASFDDKILTLLNKRNSLQQALREEKKRLPKNRVPMVEHQGQTMCPHCHCAFVYDITLYK